MEELLEDIKNQLHVKRLEDWKNFKEGKLILFLSILDACQIDMFFMDGKWYLNQEDSGDGENWSESDLANAISFFLHPQAKLSKFNGESKYEEIWKTCQRSYKYVDNLNGTIYQWSKEKKEMYIKHGETDIGEPLEKNINAFCKLIRYSLENPENYRYVSLT